MITLARPFILLDFETTGPNPETDRAVSVKLTRYKDSFPNGKEKEYYTLIRPGIPIPPAASFGVGGKYTGHGITDDKVNGCRICGMGPGDTDSHAMLGDNPHTFTPWPMFSHLAKRLAERFTNCDFGGYNIRFDLTLARNELARCGIEWDHQGASVIDAFRIWQVMRPSSLADAAKEFLGEAMQDAHDAGADVDTAGRVLVAQFERWPELPRDLRALDAMCFPGKIDADGKFAFNEAGVPCVNFGNKWKGVPMARVDLDYFKWMCGMGRGRKPTFAPSTKAVALDALKGRYPQPPADFTPAEDQV
jgi:DNA polymerase-3 subunit epsilon